MSDIVERLREGCGCNFPETTCMAESECADAFAAADEIDRLTAENERLRQVLENIQQARVLQGKSITDASNEIERLRAALESIADLPPGYADMRQDDLVVILASKARAACLAMIRAWPHATIGRHTVLSRSPSEGHAVPLPLPLTQEPTAFEMFPPDDEYNWGDT